MVYNYTSVHRVISKVFTDLDLQDSSHRISDMLEWSAEALEKIGAYQSFINKTTGRDGEPLIEIVDYQAKLPMDCHRVIQVGYSQQPTWRVIPMRYGSGSFDYNPVKTDPNTDIVGTLTVSNNDLVNVAMSLYDMTYQEVLNMFNTNPAKKEELKGLLEKGSSNKLVVNEGGEVKLDEYIYVITGGYVKTNVKTGYLTMAYQAIPTDADGYPLIPDDISFIDAITKYITMKLLYSEWKNGRCRDEVYYDSRRQWNFYCKQAYGNAMMPNIDKLESIKNSWLRLIPNITEHDTFFSTLGREQTVYNQNQILNYPNYAKISQTQL